MTASLPSESSASLAASSERIASATAVSSLVVVWGELIDQLRHPDPLGDRRIVLEGELRSALHPQLARQLRLEHPVRGLEPLERQCPLALVPEDADVDPGL